MCSISCQEASLVITNDFLSAGQAWFVFFRPFRVGFCSEDGCVVIFQNTFLPGALFYCNLWCLGKSTAPWFTPTQVNTLIESQFRECLKGCFVVLKQWGVLSVLWNMQKTFLPNWFSWMKIFVCAHIYGFKCPVNNKLALVIYITWCVNNEVCHLDLLQGSHDECDGV